MLHGLSDSLRNAHPMDEVKLTVSSPGRICEVFIKIGGSIFDDAARTQALIAPLLELAGQHRMLILVGGGRIAKRIKANQRAYNSNFYRCWRGGVLAHDVNAALLASYSTAFETAASAAEITRCFESGKVAVLAPSQMLLSNLYFVPDWRITTDSMGAYFARTMRAYKYVIVSDVDGVHARWPDTRPPIPRLTLAELERLPSSKLDSAFPAFFRQYPVSTFIVNGSHPERVRNAICGTPTLGTEIVADG